MKLCSKCDLTKELEEFPPRKDSKDGRHSYCRKCMRKIMNEAYAENPEIFKKRVLTQKQKLRSLVKEIKSKSKCHFCPENTMICLDFHHLDPTNKKSSIAALVNAKNEEALKEEIKKCILLCANCHRKFHVGLIKF
jgi:hypothetical protein